MPQSIACVRICFFADLLFRFQRVTPFPTFSVAEKRRGLLLALSPSVKKFFRFFSKPSAAHRHPRTHAKKIATAQPPPDDSFNFPTFFFSKEPDCSLPSTSAPTALFPVESGAPFSRLPLHCQLFFFGFALFFSTTRHRLPLPPPRLTTRRRKKRRSHRPRRHDSARRMA